MSTIEDLKKQILELATTTELKKHGLDEQRARQAATCLVFEGNVTIDDNGETQFVIDGKPTDLASGIKWWSQTDEGRIFTGRSLLDDVRSREAVTGDRQSLLDMLDQVRDR
ncbi:MAG TPA: hypothetical protein VGH28_26855 [Polyangiaceae bacterium]|jgi:hypothetical protein